MTTPPVSFYLFGVLISKSSLMASRLSYSKYLLTSNRTWFLCLAFVREPVSIHSLPQLLDFLAHHLVLALFIMSLCFSFVLLPISTSFSVLSFSYPIPPLVFVLLAVISLLIPTRSSFLSSFDFFSMLSSSFFLCFHSCLMKI